MRFVGLVVSAVLLLSAPPGLGAEPRIALVIGNSNYAVQPLDNPVNDASLMATTLENVGFEVILREDLAQRDFERTIIEFSRTLRAKGDDAVGMIYYAGHAVQANGVNYLIPVDADMKDELDLRVQAVDTATLLAGLEAAGNRMNVVVLDACRNNPFKGLSRSGTQGLAKIDAPWGTLIAYSTAPGGVAVDGTGGNSPYTQALARAIREPGAPIEQVFKRVRIDVMERTGQQQVPWESSSLTGDFYFLEAEPEPEPAETASLPEPDVSTADIELWKAVSATDDIELYGSYLQQFPEGVFAEVARSRIRSLQERLTAIKRDEDFEEEKSFFAAIQDSDLPDDFEAYLARWPNGLFARLARTRIEELNKISETMASLNDDTAQAAPQPDNELLLWESIKDGTTPAEFQAYLDVYPNGRFAGVARAKIAALGNTGEPAVSERKPADTDDRNVAAASPPTVAIDGKWRLTLEVGTVAREYQDIEFCAEGHVATTDTDVSGGTFDGEMTSRTFGDYIRFRGTISEDGRLTLDGRAAKNRFTAKADKNGGEIVGKMRFLSPGCTGSGRVTMKRIE